MTDDFGRFGLGTKGGQRTTVGIVDDSYGHLLQELIKVLAKEPNPRRAAMLLELLVTYFVDVQDFAHRLEILEGLHQDIVGLVKYGMDHPEVR